MNRSTFLKTTAAATAAAVTAPLDQLFASGTAAPHQLPALPYAFGALEPWIDARTMEIHHGRHHQAYVNNLNVALATAPEHLKALPIDDLMRRIGEVPADIRTAVINNGGGHANHTLFWTVMRPAREGNAPVGRLADALTRDFGSADTFFSAFDRAALTMFGSGWAWLASDAQGRLLVLSTPNQESPLMQGLTPLLGLDVWEHAYYLHYQNRRAEYVTAFRRIIDWDAVERRYAAI